jgi:hypothetical protein
VNALLFQSSYPKIYPFIVKQEHIRRVTSPSTPETIPGPSMIISVSMKKYVIINMKFENVNVKRRRREERDDVDEHMREEDEMRRTECQTMQHRLSVLMNLHFVGCE